MNDKTIRGNRSMVLVSENNGKDSKRLEPKAASITPQAMTRPGKQTAAQGKHSRERS
jgi:hypothetical protein